MAASSGDTHMDLASRESWGLRKDGRTFPIELAVSNARASRREMYVVCLRDVTDRRESEQAMRESEARYRLLVDHAPDAIVVLDADNNYAFVKRIHVWEYAASMSPEDISGVAASPATNMLYLAARGRLGAIDLATDKDGVDHDSGREVL